MPDPASPSPTPNPAPQRFDLTIAYDGAAFHGWQRQLPPNAEEPRTVQGVLETTLSRALQQPVTLTGASRTDTGVHALGQRAHVDLTTPIPHDRLADAMNARLPDDVFIAHAAHAPDTFHAIKNVTAKQYRYRIATSPMKPLWRRAQVYHHPHHTHRPFTLDLDRMNDAAARLVGTHDIAGLAAADHGRTTTIRSIHACHVTPEPNPFDPANPDLVISIEGDGFLYNTVRIVAGTLVEIGRGRLEPTRIDDILATADRTLAGPTLPPQALTLMWIRYAESHDTP
ncbi:MAG: tRNA pseudouridine(38-40) synthase TruA [Planctomycetota bacterium]